MGNLRPGHANPNGGFFQIQQRQNSSDRPFVGEGNKSLNEILSVLNLTCVPSFVCSVPDIDGIFLHSAMNHGDKAQA
jgi:hypothetical protein